MNGLQYVFKDRETTLRTYVNKYPEIWNILPPDELAERYGG